MVLWSLKERENSDELCVPPERASSARLQCAPPRRPRVCSVAGGGVRRVLWRCEAGAVALWRCEAGAVALWRCEAGAVALWRCEAGAVAV